MKEEIGRAENAYIFCLRPPIKIFASEVHRALQLLLLRLCALTIVSGQSVKCREDERCSLSERNAIGFTHGRSQTMFSLLRDAFWRSEIRVDCFVDVDPDFHVVGFGIPGQDHTVEAARAVIAIIDLVEETVVSTQERRLANNTDICRV